MAHAFVWRGSRRPCDVLFTNVRELPDESLAAPGDDWKVVIDFPFDDRGHTPVEDLDRLDRFREHGTSDTGRSSGCRRSSRPKTQAELGKLVIIDHLLRGDNLDQYAEHLSLQDRLSARLILENQQSALAGTLRLALNAAYGIASEPQPGMLDAAHEAAEGHFRSLEPGFTPQVPVGADLGGARTPARPGAGAPVPRPPALRARGQEVGLREGARRGAGGRADGGRPRGGRQAAAAGDQARGQPARPGAHGRAVLRAGEVLADPLQQADRRREGVRADGGEAAQWMDLPKREGAGAVRRQPADPGLRRADQPRLLLERPAVPEPHARQPPRRHGAAAAGAARRGRVGGGATAGEGGLRARRLRRGAAHGRERRGARGEGPGAGRAASGSRPRPGPRGPAVAGPDGRHGRGDRPGAAMEDRPGGRCPGLPGWSARTRRPP